MPRRVLLAAVLVLVASGCREADGPAGPGANAVPVLIESDPAGARILVDERDTQQRTPDTVRINPGEHTLRLSLDTMALRYEYRALLRLQSSDSVPRLRGTLTLQCPLENASSCHTAARRQHEASGMRFATSAFGALFFWSGSGQGLLWPATSSNSYVSSGMPVLAGNANNDAVALGVYDHGFVAGRPVPEVRNASGSFELTQHTWILPPFHTLIRASTVRGIQVTERLIARSDVNGAVVMRLTFRNISHTPEYRRVAQHLPPGDVTYTNTYVGFALDPDIGESSDDWLSYDPELDMVFAYDTRFSESQFGESAGTPGIVGLRVLRRPHGTNVMLNGWTNRMSVSGDWYAGTPSEVNGYNMLTGRQPYSPDHPDAKIGHLPPTEGDARITATAGPLTLAPGDSAEIVIALVVAPPAAGTYTSGAAIDPGDPLSQTRALYRVVAPLRDRMRAVEALLPAATAH